MSLASKYQKPGGILQNYTELNHNRDTLVEALNPCQLALEIPDAGEGKPRVAFRGLRLDDDPASDYHQMARVDEVNELGRQLDVEREERAEEDNKLWAAIEIERTTRAQQVLSLSNAIASERQSREQEDAALDLRITGVTNSLTAHASRTDNPHGVTKAQVQLGSVPDINATIPSNISWNANYRTVTDAEKNTWNGKQDKSTANLSVGTASGGWATLAAGNGINITGTQIANAMPNVQSDWNATSGLAQILNKPVSFTPSAHNHAAADINSGTLDVARIPNLNMSKITDGNLDWARISNKPSYDSDYVKKTGDTMTGTLQLANNSNVEIAGGEFIFNSTDSGVPKLRMFKEDNTTYRIETRNPTYNEWAYISIDHQGFAFNQRCSGFYNGVGYYPTSELTTGHGKLFFKARRLVDDNTISDTPSTHSLFEVDSMSGVRFYVSSGVPMTYDDIRNTLCEFSATPEAFTVKGVRGRANSSISTRNSNNYSLDMYGSAAVGRFDFWAMNQQLRFLLESNVDRWLCHLGGATPNRTTLRFTGENNHLLIWAYGETDNYANLDIEAATFGLSANGGITLAAPQINLLAGVTSLRLPVIANVNVIQPGPLPDNPSPGQIVIRQNALYVYRGNSWYTVALTQYNP
jgi:hypothetical protein